MPDPQDALHCDCTFPSDDSLCERCGYPLRGLSLGANCPECGLAVAQSSPGKRDGPTFQAGWIVVNSLCNALFILLYPRSEFRTMRVDEGRRSARIHLAFCLAGSALLFWSMISGEVFGYPRNGVWLGVPAAVILAMTYIEMLGVTAFSRRRGWRVPFSLAERVCCFAAVGWLPGVLIAAAGVQLLKAYAFGEPWFEQMIGLVRVSWICYAGLFVLSLLWFETLVWIGVRQVKYANARSDRPAGPASDSGASSQDDSP